jgi:hypothetical protein
MALHIIARPSIACHGSRNHSVGLRTSIAWLASTAVKPWYARTSTRVGWSIRKQPSSRHASLRHDHESWGTFVSCRPPDVGCRRRQGYRVPGTTASLKPSYLPSSPSRSPTCSLACLMPDHLIGPSYTTWRFAAACNTATHACFAPS